jgi:WD40 repeat protein
MGCTNNMMSRLWTGWLRNLISIPGRSRIFLFYVVSGLAFGPTLPPSEYVSGALPLVVKGESSEANSPYLYIAKEECIKLYPLLLHRPWYCAQGWPHFTLYRPKTQLYLFNVQNTWHWILVVHCAFQRTLEGHVGDVYKCRFFPSGLVVLSGSADMQLKIWSAETGQCPVTLRGHTAAITDMCIVDKGRNIISVSK